MAAAEDVVVVEVVPPPPAPGQLPGYPLVGTLYPREGQYVVEAAVVVVVVTGWQPVSDVTLGQPAGVQHVYVVIIPDAQILVETDLVPVELRFGSHELQLVVVVTVDVVVAGTQEPS